MTRKNTHLISQFEGLPNAGNEIARAATIAVEDVATSYPAASSVRTRPVLRLWGIFFIFSHITYKIHHVCLAGGGKGDSVETMVK